MIAHSTKSLETKHLLKEYPVSNLYDENSNNNWMFFSLDDKETNLLYTNLTLKPEEIKGRGTCGSSVF
jgi:hypothetical protein